MLYIYVELRYQRQLNKICPDVPESFFASVASCVRENGGIDSRLQSAMVYKFDETAVGSCFGVSRSLESLRGLLEQYRERIREYLILVGRADKDPGADGFADIRSHWSTLLIPDDAILLTEDAYGLLADFVTCERLQDIPLLAYSGALIPREAAVTSGKETLPARLYLYPSDRDHSIGPYLEMLGRLEPSLLEPDLAEAEKSAFEETRNARDMYLRYRFSGQQPEYRIAACVDYVRYVLRSLSAKLGKPVEIAVFEDRPKPGLFSAMGDKLSGVCSFVSVPFPEFESQRIASMPQDLKDLSYLALRAVPFLHVAELPGFFASLGKAADFIADLGSFMRSVGLIADPADFRSINPPVVNRLFEAESERASELDYRIGEYLWTLYEKGALHCDFSLYEAFDSLSFNVPDAFLVSCLYSSVKSPIPAIEGLRARFANPAVPEMVLSLEAAFELYRTGMLDEAFSVAKDTLHSFQKTGILPGEYRTLLLMAMLAFARKKGDDAIVYLEYALENAETMHDPLSALSTRFAMAIVHFITGNYHFSLCNLESVGKTVEASYAKDWEVLILFMKGRLLFELGNYPDAEILFQTAASLASVHQIPDSVSLCRVWYARSLTHQKRYATAEGILSDCAQTIPEAILYLLESSLLSGRRIETVELPISLEMPRDRLSWGPEGFSWRSGYSIAEDLCYGAAGGQNVPERMYEALKLLYDWRFGAESDDASTAVSLARLARKALEESDPYAASYCLFCYEMGQSGNLISGADSMVFLSLGFKYMQRRANEIDDNALREQFMRNPTHNGRLYREARVHMLI